VTRCIGVKPDGELCRGVATRASDYCPAHDPGRQEARKRSASKAARSKRPQRKIADIKEQVSELIQAVRDQEMERGDAIACGQLFNTVLRAISVGLKVKDVEELEGRLEELEALLDSQRQEGTRR
jgi:hypothetical protein